MEEDGVHGSDGVDVAEPVSYIPQGYELWALAYPPLPPGTETPMYPSYMMIYSSREALAEHGIHLGRVIGWTVLSDGGVQPLCPEFTGVQGKKSLKYSVRQSDLRDQAEFLLKAATDAAQ